MSFGMLAPVEYEIRDATTTVPHQAARYPNSEIRMVAERDFA